MFAQANGLPINRMIFDRAGQYKGFNAALIYCQNIPPSAYAIGYSAATSIVLGALSQKRIVCAAAIPFAATVLCP